VVETKKNNKFIYKLENEEIIQRLISVRNKNDWVDFQYQQPTFRGHIDVSDNQIKEIIKY
jgi:hypothetical protein